MKPRASVLRVLALAACVAVLAAGTPPTRAAHDDAAAVTERAELAKNSPNNPQFVRDVDNPARNEPFQAIANAAFAAGVTSMAVDAAAVPAGKLLVIEHVSAFVSLPFGSGQTAAGVVQLLSSAGSAKVQHAIVLTAQGQEFGFDNSTASQPIRIYASTGDHLRLVVNRSDGAGAAQIALGATGYFLPN